MKRVLISGSREIVSFEPIVKVWEIIMDKHVGNFVLVHGAAIGVDSMFDYMAELDDIEVEKYKPNYVRYDAKVAPRMRNIEMADTMPDEAYVVWDGVSTGTKHMMEELDKRKIPYRLFDQKGNEIVKS